MDKKEQIDTLVALLVRADNEGFVRNLLEDLFTYKEIGDLASRLNVALLLDSGVSYSEIEKQTGASATTIARVSKCLNHGAGGYQEAIRILKGESAE